MRYARTKYILLVVFSVIISACAQVNPWQGRYSYEANYGKNVPGTEMGVDYTLTVNKSGETPAATLVMQGYQTDETIFCDITFTANEASFLFKSYDNGQTKNKYGVEQYKPGEVLFTLERPTTSGAKRLITHWKGLNPDDKRKSGFKKVPGQMAH